MDTVNAIGPDGVIHEFNWEMASGLYTSNCGRRPTEVGEFKITSQGVSCMLCLTEPPKE